MLQAGSNLGPYEIVEPLGEGGMGQVYVAEDTRLGRRVAIKVLPAAFAADPERRARFEQEARAAAALNHPHIAAIHDVGVGEDADSGEPVHYMVQELLAGSTLQEALAGRRWPLPRVLTLATEIAEALAAAHAAGIVHRDLKPANVFVTEQGHAKVLDFGLAKLTEPVGSAASATSLTAADHSPTVLGTVAGQIMGTAGYMAPEQVEGGKIDGRADVFAFGCVLYEMCAGRRPFAGRSVLQTLDLIIHEDPEPLQPGPEAPPRLLWILEKCLAKDPDARYQSAADLVVDLRRLASDVVAGRAGGAESTPVAEPVVSDSKWSPVAVLGAAFLATVLATAGITAWLRRSELPPTPAVQRFHTTLPDGIQLTNVGRPVVAISPDGRRVAVSAGAPGGQVGSIWIRDLDEDTFHVVKGAEIGRAPVFSPDGQEILFWKDENLVRIAAVGGVAVPVVRAENPWGASWLEDDTILYGQGSAGIWRVPVAGGEPEQLYQPADAELAHGPQLLGDGHLLLMTLTGSDQTWDEGRIVVLSLDSGELVELVRPGRDGRVLPSGQLVYAQGNTVLAQRFDEQALKVTGAPVPVLEGVMGAVDRTGTAQFSVAGDGTLVYAAAAEEEAALSQRLIWEDLDGNTEETPLPDVALQDYRVSPDGTLLAAVALPERELMVFDLASGTGRRLAGGIQGSWPVWSADQRWIYYGRDLGQVTAVYRVPADDSGPPEPVVQAEDDLVPEDIAADGSFLVLRRTSQAHGGSDLVLYRPGDATLEDLAATPASEKFARLSPEQRYLAYTSAQATPSSFESHVLVLDLETGARHAVSAAEDDAMLPRWSSDDQRIYYVAAGDHDDDIVKAVSISTAGAFRAARPEPVLSLDMGQSSDTSTFDMSGDRVLVPSRMTATVRFEEERQYDHLVFVTGWFGDVRRRLQER